jgi:hypothetical protein
MAYEVGHIVLQEVLQGMHGELVAPASSRNTQGETLHVQYVAKHVVVVIT